MSDPVLVRRGRHNALRRYRPADDPAVVAAAEELREARRQSHLHRLVEDDSLPFTDQDRAHFAVLLAEHIDQVVNSAPALNAEQLERCRALLPADGGAADES